MARNKEVFKQLTPDDAERVPYFFPFLWKDWWSDQSRQDMSPSDKGIFIEMLVHQWVLNELPTDINQLCRITGARRDVMREWMKKWGSEVLWCLECKEKLTPEDVSRICTRDVEEVSERCTRDVEEVYKRCTRGGKHVVKRCFNRKQRYLRFDVTYKVPPGTFTEEPIPRPNLTEPRPNLFKPTSKEGGENKESEYQEEGGVVFVSQVELCSSEVQSEFNETEGDEYMKPRPANFNSLPEDKKREIRANEDIEREMEKSKPKGANTYVSQERVAAKPIKQGSLLANPSNSMSHQGWAGIGQDTPAYTLWSLLSRPDELGGGNTPQSWSTALDTLQARSELTPVEFKGFLKWMVVDNLTPTNQENHFLNTARWFPKAKDPLFSLEKNFLKVVAEFKLQLRIKQSVNSTELAPEMYANQPEYRKKKYSLVAKFKQNRKLNEAKN